MDLSTQYLGFTLPHPLVLGASPLVDPTFDEAERLAGAPAICAVVATPQDDPEVGAHQIADTDGDGAPDPDSGDCVDV